MVLSCDFSSDNKYVISSDMDGMINACNLETQKMDMAYNTLEF